LSKQGEGEFHHRKELTQRGSLELKPALAERLE